MPRRTELSRTERKLDQARAHLEAMRHAPDGRAFRAACSGFFSAARSITWALKKDVAGLDEAAQDRFAQGYEAKEAEMRADPLVRFVKLVRNADQKRGDDGLRFEMNLVAAVRALNLPRDTREVSLVSTTEGLWCQAGGRSILIDRPPAPDWGLVFGSDGTYWERAGRPSARRPVAGLSHFAVAFEDPPSSHLGQPIPDTRPPAVCELALRYFEALVQEAYTIL